MKSLAYITGICLLLMTATACNKDGKVGTDNDINIFSIQDDIEMGQNVAAQIEGDPANYPILEPNQYTDAYEHLYGIRDKILNTGLVSYKDQFEWRIRIIRNDQELNAFAVPGGYLYVYTGLIKFLDNEAQFAGVLAHEMAHVARRHSTDQLTRAYGIDLILSIILGDNASQLAQIAAGLASGLSTLAFSRDDELEADKFAVDYLYATDYNAPSLGDFFIKLGTASGTPTFLSTHPNPENRIENINQEWQTLGGATGALYETEYAQFKAMLP